VFGQLPEIILGKTGHQILDFSMCMAGGVPFHQSAFSSKRLFIKAPFHQSAFSSRRLFIKWLVHQMHNFI
jgi:hypothetical protein